MNRVGIDAVTPVRSSSGGNVIDWMKSLSIILKSEHYNAVDEGNPDWLGGIDIYLNVKGNASLGTHDAAAVLVVWTLMDVFDTRLHCVSLDYV